MGDRSKDAQESGVSLNTFFVERVVQVINRGVGLRLRESRKGKCLNFTQVIR